MSIKRFGTIEDIKKRLDSKQDKIPRYYLDTEFAEYDDIIALISIGIVGDDGRELYLQSCEFNSSKASRWVKENVFPHLQTCPWAETVTHPSGIQGLCRADRAYHERHGGQCLDEWRGHIHNCPWRTRFQMRNELAAFFPSGEKFELHGWCAGYDFVALCQLFGGMLNLPQNWPHYIRDLQYLLDERGIADEDLPQQEDGLHNALEDARHLKRLWEYVQ